MLKLQPLAKGSVIFSARMPTGKWTREQTQTLQCWGCSTAPRKENTFSLRNPSIPHLEKQIQATLQYCKVSVHSGGMFGM